ncbi:unnamed protein product, partial [marine sediment metagenome]
MTQEWIGHHPTLTQDEILHMLEHDMEMAARDWSRAEGISHRFKHMRDHILATEMKLAEKKGFSKVGEQEREAKASGFYMNWINESSQAVETVEYYKHRYWTMKSRLDIFLNQQADERARV